jgi:hypothetical protein
MISPGTALRRLAKALLDLETKFLLTHSAEVLGAPNNDFIIDTRAYVVLAHAEFEEFFEQVASWVVENAHRLWFVRRRISSAALCMALECGPGVEKEKGPLVMFNSHFAALLAAKATLSARIHQQNNGIAPKHLREMLWPLGVELPDPATQRSGVWSSLLRP